MESGAVSRSAPGAPPVRIGSPASRCEAEPFHDPDAWTRVERRLAFRLGELTLLSVRLRAAALRTHFSRIGVDAADARPPASLFDEPIRVAIADAPPARERLARLGHAGPFLRYAPTVSQHRAIEVRGSFDDYLHALTAKHRHELLRKHRLAFQGSRGAHVETYRGVNGIGEFLAAARGISARSYQERLLHLGLPRDPEWRARALLAAERDRVRGFILFLRDRPVSYAYLAEIDDRVLGFQCIGYDDRFGDLSPGLALIHDAIESVFAERRFSLIDLGGGDSRLKREIATMSRRCATVFYFRGSLADRLLASSHALVDGASSAAGALLRRCGVKERLRRLLRRQG